MAISFWTKLSRRKGNSDDSSETSELKRCLNLFDLTALGVGSTLGLGAYVLAGAVAHEQAGPAVTISFVIAAVASAIAGFCYAEFAARVPKAGSAYVYSYVSVGEFVAFSIGWNLVLEYVIGTSSVARGLSGYVDSLANNQMSEFFKGLVHFDVGFLGEYPDLFSFVIVMLITFLLAFGVKESSWLNNTFTSVNILTILLMFITGCMKADPQNWQIAKEDIPSDANGGEGGFMPFGVAGVMAGAAKCFFGFTGFDCVATTGEEAKNPQRNIPLAIIISLVIIFFAYFGISTVLTMMAPYYLLDVEAPFPKLYESFGWTEVKWVVSVGTIFALCTSLLGAMFPLPRILYAMGSDGIIYKFLSKVSQRTMTPLVATLLSGTFAAVMAMIFAIHQLIEMMSIGTLLAYTIVAISVLVLRYQCSDEHLVRERNFYEIEFGGTFARQLFNVNGIKHANALTSQICKLAVVIFSVLCVALCVFLQVVSADILERENLWQIAVIAVLVAGMLLTTFAIARQPQVQMPLYFKVPLVPYFPLLSVFINTYLMCQLEYQTWIRFAIWLFIGYFIYFTYGIRNSTGAEGSQGDTQVVQMKPPAIGTTEKRKTAEADIIRESYKQRVVY